MNYYKKVKPYKITLKAPDNATDIAKIQKKKKKKKNLVSKRNVNGDLKLLTHNMSNLILTLSNKTLHLLKQKVWELS